MVRSISNVSVSGALKGWKIWRLGRDDWFRDGQIDSRHSPLHSACSRRKNSSQLSFTTRGRGKLSKFAHSGTSVCTIRKRIKRRPFAHIYGSDSSYTSITLQWCPQAYASIRSSRSGDMRLSRIFSHDKTFKQPVVWVTTFVMVAFHIGALAALFAFSWEAFIVAMLLWWVAGGLGVGVGYHRLLTHQVTKLLSGWNIV